ncbi:MAG: hypothetical protein HOE19_01395 [Candidatus Komeilibacteria bacterium]|jgi:hypothetical protein|nr:hypothetical protein [Candidatus Komeilibacteria bacterium]MBT4447635.1 hypothetical protein [Candidatus Komeilibacteria bacterium]
MNEKFTAEQTPDKKEAELIAFFESHGYENVQLIPHRNRNDIIHATKNGQECFIKKLNPTSGAEKSVSKKMDTESACYENLPEDILINVVEINADEGYIVLGRVEFDEIEENEQYIEDLADVELNKFPNIDASFLPETTWEDYEKLFIKLKKLEEAEIIEDADAIIQIFESKKELIENVKKIFSQQDFNRSNIKKVDGQLKIFDFEESRQDNAMADMATMSIDIRNNEKLSATYKERIQASESYNEELFNLMTAKRAALVMYARLYARGDEIESAGIPQFVQDNIDAFHEAVDKLAA